MTYRSTMTSCRFAACLLALFAGLALSHQAVAKLVSPGVIHDRYKRVCVSQFKRSPAAKSCTLTGNRAIFRSGVRCKFTASCKVRNRDDDGDKKFHTVEAKINVRLYMAPHLENCSGVLRPLRIAMTCASPLGKPG